MTWRWTVSIAALAGVALASLVLASSGPKADEQAAIKLAGAGAEGGQAANTNESKDASPQDDSDATQAGPAAGAGDEKAAAPADATAGATDGKEQEKPDTSAEKNKSEEAAPAAPEEKAASKEEGEKAESKEGDKTEQTSVDSEAAAEKVKSGEIPVPADPVALAAFRNTHGVVNPEVVLGPAIAIDAERALERILARCARDGEYLRVAPGGLELAKVFSTLQRGSLTRTIHGPAVWWVDSWR